MHRLWKRVHGVAVETFGQWRRHRSAEMAAALAFYGAIALAGLTLIAVYAGALASRARGVRAYATGQTAHATGSHNAQLLDYVLREAASRHYGWVALAVGLVVFGLAIVGTALQMQRVIDVIWRPDDRGDRRPPADQVRKHAPQFLMIIVLALVLAFLLFAGAGIHGLMSRTHGLPFAIGLLYQALDVAVSIVLLTFVFLCIFAYLPPVDVPWKQVWPAAFVGAVLYERGQFGLSVYIGQMDAKSPYAAAGALLVILIWLYYSAQVVVVGADLTKVLKTGADASSRRHRRGPGKALSASLRH